MNLGDRLRRLLLGETMPQQSGSNYLSPKSGSEERCQDFRRCDWRENFWPDPSVADQPIQELVQQADFLKLNDKEAKKLFGTPDPKAIAQRLAKCVLVTAGKQGCAYYREGTSQNYLLK
jgi:fructokinase